jgi:hypothetical protein
VSQRFVTEARTAVTYHERRPSYVEQVKIRLPVRVTRDHHILAVFEHVHCQKLKGKATNRDNAVRAPVCTERGGLTRCRRRVPSVMQWFA